MMTSCSATCVHYPPPLATLHLLGRGAAREGQISFVNPWRLLRQPQGSGSGVDSSQDGNHYRLSCREDRSLLDRIGLLQIQILSTEGSAVPGLRKLRLMGRPSDPAALGQLAAAARRQAQHRQQATIPLVFFGSGRDEVEEVEKVDIVPLPASGQHEARDTAAEVDLPVEFLDEITQEWCCHRTRGD
jgi:hypothetical protein